jgi:hypothetical protein
VAPSDPAAAPASPAAPVTSSSAAPITSPSAASPAPSLGILPADGPPAEARATAERPASRTGRAPRPRSAQTAAGRQASDARALADIMSANGPARSTRAPRAPSESQPTTAPSEAASPTPPAPARVMSGPRTAAPSTAGAIVLSRPEVDRALADFATLSAAIRASFSDAGVVVSDVGSGTIFQRAGLEPGDTITTINGAPLRSIDDAANLYARASTASVLTIQLVRAGRPVTLRVVIQ